MEIQTEDYSIVYESSTETITCKGSLRLSGMEEYEPIVNLLNQLAEKEPSEITLNLQKLEFLNSSGINVLSKYVIRVRQKGTIKMLVQGSKDIPWQGKSLKNLQRLMPALQLELQ
ncbi:MAG: STAS domain-containing protein [Coleofasciculaceae cyanobacterium]